MSARKSILGVYFGISASVCTWAWQPYAPVFTKLTQCKGLIHLSDCYFCRVSSLLDSLKDIACGDDPRACSEALRNVQAVAHDFGMIRPILDHLINQRRTSMEDKRDFSRHLSAPSTVSYILSHNMSYERFLSDS